MLDAIFTPYLVPYDGSFALAQSATKPPADAPTTKDCKDGVEESVKELSKIQRILYAHDYHAVLLIFQAMDSAGKDGTIRAVLSGLNPAGCQVYSFKQPSKEGLDHDFLWRCTKRLPERGRIGVFNRSYYEEVLVVRVHSEYLKPQRVQLAGSLDQVWADRYQAIRDYEWHLAKTGTLVLKFWLNISKQEQRNRFISRVDEPEKNWKFSEADVNERQFWDDYMAAYEIALRETSRPWAPWYAIPADDKAFMRLSVAQTILANVQTLQLQYPEVSEEDRNRFKSLRKMLKADEL
jgi:PPK2 family polyphosphate:nucleotide phosphotransferase